jgi:aspartate aminotransferase-like enzyme
MGGLSLAIWTGRGSIAWIYTDDPQIQNGRKFAEQGLQIAAGVPLMCDEGDDYRSFRIGLFGLDKLQDVGRTVNALADALDRIMAG